MASVVLREVFETNLEAEFLLINSALKNFPIVSFDTEFPGTVHEPTKPFYMLTNSEKYASMIKNVNSSKIIQLGLCLSDAQGNLPNFGSNYGYIWEFNFREFDEEVDAQNPTSIQLLKNQGIDFQRNKIEGIDSHHFACLFLASGFGSSARSILGHHPMSGIGTGFPKITWVLFHALYDLGYLIKILTNQDLPDDQFQFVLMVFTYLGFSVFDVKEIASPLGLHGGLDQVAQTLGVPRQGTSHQAGSDSLLTMQVFLKLHQLYFSGKDNNLLQNFNHKLYGLEKADLSDVQRSLGENRKRNLYAAMHKQVEVQRRGPLMMPCPPFAIVRGPPVPGRFLRVPMPPLRARVPIAMY